MKRSFILLCLFLFTAANTFATWSIVAVDRDTGQIVIASATCLPQNVFPRLGATGLKDLQAIIIPGVGAAAAQARIDVTRRAQNLIAEEIKKGTAPEEIIKKLKEMDPMREHKQYGIVDLQGRTAGFSGALNGKVSLDRQGRVEGTQIYFSIQGNILTKKEVIEDAVKAFTNAKGTLADRVMAAMDAADAQGGDSRCNCDIPPKPVAPCETRTAFVAYIVICNKTDPAGKGLNDGKYTLELSVTDQNILPTENGNPVKTLRMRYDKWKKENIGK
jgi:uncharacterized Ntn-hydrolase superfamily protein